MTKIKKVKIYKKVEGRSNKKRRTEKRTKKRRKKINLEQRKIKEEI